MPRPRRFQVPSLAAATVGARIALPPDEAHHARVLRLKPGAPLELFDPQGRAWRAELAADGASAVLIKPVAGVVPAAPEVPRLILATAWPKGRRAAFLVEKCTELGVSEIAPLVCARSVVVKDAGSSGMARLRRIASEAAKQSGRTDVPQIHDPQSLDQFVRDASGNTLLVLLDPGAERLLSDVLRQECGGAGRTRPVAILVGPEGGFTVEEIARAASHGAVRAKLAANVLRVETAAIAACAICRLAALASH
jgi:16S rRNA (uracil1498-N3)-methyltransferase